MTFSIQLGSDTEICLFEAQNVGNLLAFVEEVIHDCLCQLALAPSDVLIWPHLTRGIPS